MLNDGLKLTGKLSIAINDEVVQEVPNLVVTAGKNYVADRIKNNSTVMSHMASALRSGGRRSAPTRRIFCPRTQGRRHAAVSCIRRVQRTARENLSGPSGRPGPCEVVPGSVGPGFTVGPGLGLL